MDIEAIKAKYLVNDDFVSKMKNARGHEYARRGLSYSKEGESRVNLDVYIKNAGISVKKRPKNASIPCKHWPQGIFLLYEKKNAFFAAQRSSLRREWKMAFRDGAVRTAGAIF